MHTYTNTLTLTHTHTHTHTLTHTYLHTYTHTKMQTALATRDYTGMARALANMGATETDVNIQNFANDIEAVLDDIFKLDVNVNVETDRSGTAAAVGIGFDDNQVTKVLLNIVEVTERNGLKLPREFGLLVKQSLYFDRYLKILAPEVDVVSDERVKLGNKKEIVNSSDVVVDV